MVPEKLQTIMLKVVQNGEIWNICNIYKKGEGDIRRRKRRQDICTVGVMADRLEGGE